MDNTSPSSPVQHGSSRELYLVVYNRSLFKAHWALFVPTIDDPNVGRRIHATGDARTGFEVAFDRNYNLAATSRAHTSILVGRIDAAYIDDASALGDGTHSTDSAPLDSLETHAASVPAPGPSLRSSSSGGKHSRVEIKDCQTWLRDFVTSLVQAGILHPDAIAVVDNAPEH